MAAPRESSASLLARGAQLLKAGRSGEALTCFRQSAQLQPDNFVLQHDLGVACMMTGRFPEAIAALHRAIALNPRFAKAYWRLGVAYETQGDAAEAIAAYRRAAELQPSLADVHFQAGNLLETHGHMAEAIASFRRAAASGGKTGLGRLGAARALLAENKHSEAERVLRQAVAADAANATASDLLGTLLAETGRFEDAAACYECAIRHDPTLAGSYYDMVRCRRIASTDSALVARIDTALLDKRLTPRQLLKAHLARGKVAEDLGDYALAMEHFDKADDIRRTLAAFDIGSFAALVERLIASYAADLTARAPTTGGDDPTPVMILGMPRSGTTLVEQVVSSHPEVSAGGEMNYWDQRGWQWLQSNVGAGDADFLGRAAADYLAVLRAVAPGAARVTDKMPRNFLWVGLIHLALPRATIIHCRRAPIDTALSIHQTYFNPRLPFPTGGEPLVAYYRLYQRLVAHWRRVLPEDRFIELDYEALTAHPEQAARRIIAACGLKWNDDCLYPERNNRVVRTASKWQVRQPIHCNATQRWRRYEPWLGPLRALLGGNSVSITD